MDAVASYDWDGLADGLVEEMRPFYLQLLQLAGGETSRLLPIGVAFDQSNPLVAATVDRLGQKIRGVADSVKQQVGQIVTDGLDKGQSLREIASTLQDFAVTDSAKRADMIARTESANAYSIGSVMAYQEAGVQQKKWLASPGSCDECMGMDGEVVGLDEEFSGGIDHPPLHPNCTCAVAPVV